MGPVLFCFLVFCLVFCILLFALCRFVFFSMTLSVEVFKFQFWVWISLRYLSLLFFIMELCSTFKCGFMIIFTLKQTLSIEAKNYNHTVKFNPRTIACFYIFIFYRIEEAGIFILNKTNSNCSVIPLSWFRTW